MSGLSTVTVTGCVGKQSQVFSVGVSPNVNTKRNVSKIGNCQRPVTWCMPTYE